MFQVTVQTPEPEYQMFVSHNNDVCLLQSAPEIETGRFIKVFNSKGEEKYHINLDLWNFGMSRDESICLYTNGAVLVRMLSIEIVVYT